jgi:pimeloyl-ACP methyl ester carboxylesterase
MTMLMTRHLTDRPHTLEAADGTPLFVRGPIGDSGGPPVVALHGLSGVGASFVPLLVRAAHRRRAWALDLRGHGGSGHATGGYALDDHVSDAITLLEAIGEPAVVVGHSLGGIVATVLAQEGHPLVSAVFLEDPPTYVFDPASLAAGGFVALFTALEQAVTDLQAEGAPLEAYEALFAAAPHPLGGTNADRVLADARTTRCIGLQQLDPDVFRAVLDGRTTAGFDPDRPLRVPGLVVRAGDGGDPAFRAEDEARLRATSPHVSVVEVAGTGHNIRGEVAGRERYVALLADFLARHR